MKRTVKLSGRELRRMISESVNAILESEMPILHGEGNGEVYRDDAFVTDWRDNPNDDPNKVKAPYNSYVWNKKFSKHYPTPESFWNPKDTRAYKYTNDLDKIHKEEDKFKKSEDLKTQRALDAADSRPLHRKGSLNRVGMDENVIGKIVSESIRKTIKEEIDTGQVPSASERHSTSPSAPEIRKKIRLLRNKISDYEEKGKDTSDLTKQIKKLKKEAGFCESTNRIQTIVSESIKKVLNEKWYPEEEDDISDYSFGMIAKLSTRSLMQLDEETIARLEQVNDENIETESSYVSVMVRNVNASCDDDGDCTLTIECAVSAPDMPIDEIEQEVEEILWYWVENITGQSLINGFDWESEDTVFDYRNRYK